MSGETTDYQAKPLVVLFDTDHAGHIPTHVTALAEAILDGKYSIEPIFCLPQAIVDRLSPRVVSAFKSGKLRFEPLADVDVADCNGSKPFVRGRKKWSLGQRLALEHGADHVFYFVLDIILAGALLDALSLKRSTAFSGILFRPRLHLVPVAPESLGERIRRWRQYPYYLAALLLPKLRYVWTLDSFLPAYAKNRLPNGDKVRFISEYKILSGDSGPRTETKPGAPISFLMFGLLKQRKGILVLLRAMMVFTDEDWRNMRVVLLGEFDHDTRDQALEILAQLRTKAGDRLRMVNAYVSNEQIEQEVAQCDVLLANYLNHIGSSGVAFTAALAGKPILTQETGLLGELTRQYDLGITTDTSSPTAVLEAMRKISARIREEGGFSSEGQARYVANNSRPFTDQILVDLSSQ